MLTTVLLIAAVAIAFYGVYFTLHKLFPSLGTVLVNVLAVVAMVTDFAMQLPWTTVLDSKEAALITFSGVAIGNILARLTGRKFTVGSGL